VATPRRRLAWLVAFGGTAIGGAVLLSSGRATRPTAIATNAAPKSSGANATAATPAPKAEPTTAPMATVAPAAAAAPATTAAAPLAVRVERARLLLLGDGTQVQVDGVPRGRCPQRVAIEPGTHSVVFNFPATGESRSEALTVGPGERATLRADFTGATPTVRVER
jgi:hypothetical protein